MSRASLQSLGAAAAAAVLVTSFFILGVLGRVEGTPISISEHRATLARLFPQRWSFFTKAPTDERIHLYHQRDGGWSEVNLVAGIGFESRLGFSRDHRSANQQLGSIAREMLPIEWFRCETDLEACISGPPTTAVVNQFHPGFGGECGQFALVMRAPVPWEWRDTTTNMPARFAKFEVPCSVN